MAGTVLAGTVVSGQIVVWIVVRIVVRIDVRIDVRIVVRIVVRICLCSCLRKDCYDGVAQGCCSVVICARVHKQKRCGWGNAVAGHYKTACGAQNILP